MGLGGYHQHATNTKINKTDIKVKLDGHMQTCLMFDQLVPCMMLTIQLLNQSGSVALKLLREAVSKSRQTHACLVYTHNYILTLHQ